MARRKSDTDWITRFAAGGWVLVEDNTGTSQRVLVRMEDEGDRYRIRELHLLDPGDAITNERLRSVPVSGVEQLLNLPEERAAIEATLGKKAPFDTEAALRHFKELAEPKPPTQTLAIGKVPSSSVLRGVSLESAATLERPSRGHDDAFYEQVAAKYRAAMRRSPARPVAAIQAEAKVPRSTAARWVKEARRRGLLGAAPAPGKVGG